MAKTKEQKYKEAVIRNIKSNIRYIVHNGKYYESNVFPCIDPVFRMKLGIKPHDAQFDDVIKKEISLYQTPKDSFRYHM